MFKSHLHFIFCGESAQSLCSFLIRLLKLIAYIGNQFSNISYDPPHQTPPPCTYHLAFGFGYGFYHAGILNNQTEQSFHLWFLDFVWYIERPSPFWHLKRICQWLVLKLLWVYFTLKFLTHKDFILLHGKRFESHFFSQMVTLFASTSLIDKFIFFPMIWNALECFSLGFFAYVMIA